MSAIDQGRYTVAAGAVGLAQACLDASVKYAHERQTFGDEIGKHQLVKQMLAKMVAGIEAGRLLVWRAGFLKNHGVRNTRETSLAKWHATDHAVQSALDAIQIHGANGYSNEFPVERYLRNAKAAVIYEGTSPAPHAHPGRLCPRLSRGPAAALRAAAGRGLRPAPGVGRRGHRPRLAPASRPRSRPASSATLRALASTFVPAADAERVAGIAADGLVRAVDPAQLTQLRLVLRVLEQPLANLATGAGFAAFRDMARRLHGERLLLRWARSPLLLRRSGSNAFRKLLTFIAYADPGPPEAPNPLHARSATSPTTRRFPRELAAIRPLAVDRSAARRERRAGRASRPTSSSSAPAPVAASSRPSWLAPGGASSSSRPGPFVDESTMPRDELDAYGRLYLNYGLLSTWDGAITMLAGSGVGGGTLVNWMTCLDVPAEVRAEWAREHGLDGLDGASGPPTSRRSSASSASAPATVIPAEGRADPARRRGPRLGCRRHPRNATDCGVCGSLPVRLPRAARSSPGIRAHLAEAAAQRGRDPRSGAGHVAPRRGRPGDRRRAGVAGTLVAGSRPSTTRARRAGPRPRRSGRRQVVLAAGALRSPRSCRRRASTTRRSGGTCGSTRCRRRGAH